MYEKVSEQTESQSQQRKSEKRRSRRQLLGKGIAAAAATLGAGVMLETGTAHAQSNMPADNVGNFSSSNASVPAVTATGTNGATGINASSDTSHGLVATSSGTGVSAVFAVGAISGYGVYAKCRGGTGVTGEGGSGTGVYGYTDAGGVGVVAYSNSTSGTALRVDGTMKMTGSSVGQATLPAGSTSVTVTAAAATASSNVLLTPLGKPAGFMWVTLAVGSFTIHSSKASTSSLSIAYLIIN